MLIANAVPAEHEIPADDHGRPYREPPTGALEDGVTGKAVTPFLLARILELTNGASLKTNIALVENNARLAASIAKAL